MAQQRASTVSRDERADRRVSQAEVEAAAARAAAAVEAAREVAERALTPAATLMTGTDEDLVAKSANVRVSTGRTPRTGNDGDGDGDDDDGVVMVSMTNPDTGTGGQGDGGQARQDERDQGLPSGTSGSTSTCTAGDTCGTTNTDGDLPRPREGEEAAASEVQGTRRAQADGECVVEGGEERASSPGRGPAREWREHEVFIEMVASFEG
ncbi:hypothetical protein PF005_g27864 [Phytophthora fragariae]|uniref:Uncharacterized protein n=1 Tax=Phytophthora fragariae TaxID=53985 RepID=A0A6A3VPN0_9STRA|nr:hypothetical protein PF005_g27864 [Phytophthora fragariae]KAE9176858.1 hypothetical protein PF002_g28493 [Phytophthora fragariae]